MKRKDSALNPSRKPPRAVPKLLCGAPLGGGETCQHAVSSPGPCFAHGGGVNRPDPGLPAGVRVHKAFLQEDRQAELEKYVATVSREYALNEAADLRQAILSGVAYVRLLFDGATMEPKEMDMLSRVVDRHLRNLRATPKEQAAGKVPGGPAEATGLLGAGMMPAGILERVRLALTPTQVRELTQGRQPVVGGARLSDGPALRQEPVELAQAVEVAPADDGLFAEPGRAAPDPFAALDAEDEDPFGD